MTTASEERRPSCGSEDGPVIVKVCGASSNVQPTQNPPAVFHNTWQQPMTSFPSTQRSQANASLPKIQYVTSGDGLVPRTPYHHPPVHCRETFILPEHRFLGHRSNGMPISQGNKAGSLQATTIPIQSSVTSNIAMNCAAANNVGMQGQLSGVAVPCSGSVPVCIQKTSTGPIHRIATVRPQQVLPSTSIIPVSQTAVQQTTQVPQPPHVQPAPSNHPRPGDRNTQSTYQASRHVPPQNNENDSPTARLVLMHSQSGNTLTTSKQSGVRSDQLVAFRDQCPETVAQITQEDQAQTKEDDPKPENTPPANSTSSQYRIRGFHEMLPDSYPNVKHNCRAKADSVPALGRKQRSQSTGETASKSSELHTSQEVTAPRRRRPPLGCPCCSPDTSKRNTAGSQNSEKRQGNISPTHVCRQQQSHSQLGHDKDQLMVPADITRANAQGVATQSALSSAFSQQQCLPVTQPSLNSQHSISTAASANQTASTTSNYQYHQNLSKGQLNFPTSAQQSLQTGNTHPVAPENAYLKQSFEVPRPVQPTQLVPQQTGAQNSPAPVRKSLDRPVSFRQQETRGFPNQMAQAGFHHQRRGHPPQTQIYYNPNEQIAPHKNDYSTVGIQGYIHHQQQHHQHQHQQRQQQQQQLQPLQQLLPQQPQQLPLPIPPPPQQLQQQLHQQQQQPQPQQQRQQQYQLPQHYQQYQQQLQPSWLTQYQQRAGYLQPPAAPNQLQQTMIYPKSHLSTQPLWQYNRQFTVPNMNPNEMLVPGQSVRFNNTTNAKNYHSVQAPLSQTQPTTPFECPPQSMRDGTYYHQEMQTQAYQNQRDVPISSGQVSQQHLRHNQMVDASPNGLQSSQLAVPLRNSPNASFLLSNQSLMRFSTSSMQSTQNGTQANSTNVVRKLSSLSGRENGHPVVRSASLSNPTTPSSSKTITDDRFPESQCVTSSASQSETNDYALALTVRGAQMGSVQDSNLKNGGKVTPKEDASLVSTIYQGGSGYFQSSPSQPSAESTLSHNANNSVRLPICTEKDNHCNQTLSIPHQDDSTHVYTPEDRLHSQARAMSRLEDHEDGKVSNHLDSIKPVLSVEQSDNGIILSWDLKNREDESKVVKYELYVMSVATEAGRLANWESLGIVDALALPMACTMTQFLQGASYHFAVRAITANGQCELFSDPCSITVNGSH